MAEEASQQPPSKRTKFNYSESFDVLVGPEKQRFTVIHDLLVPRSGFFEAARSARWSSSPSRPTDLSDHDPQEFSDYLEVVYTGDLKCTDKSLSQWYDDNPEDDVARWDGISPAHNLHLTKLAKAYVLADKLGDPESANIIMDVFINLYDVGIDMLLPPLMSWIYEHTPQTSALRNVVRDIVVYEANMEFLYAHGQDEFPSALLWDVTREHKLIWEEKRHNTVSEAYPYRIVKSRPKCHYHQHDDKHPKCK